ncbi:hypothetical protein C0J52_00442 [Blattella germanica]|nr:hypothetical protein C0J52_00442 [Blattella germanica]
MSEELYALSTVEEEAKMWDGKKGRRGIQRLGGLPESRELCKRFKTFAERINNRDPRHCLAMIVFRFGRWSDEEDSWVSHKDSKMSEGRSVAVRPGMKIKLGFRKEKNKVAEYSLVKMWDIAQFI